MHITRICPSGWVFRGLLQDHPQTASSFYLGLCSTNDMSVGRWKECGCISCRVAPRNGTTILCLTCYDNALRAGPVLINVSEDHENFKSGTLEYVSSAYGVTYHRTVESQFKESWRHNTTCPQVRAVYKIVNTEASLKKYEEYLYDSFHVLSLLAFFY